MTFKSVGDALDWLGRRPKVWDDFLDSMVRLRCVRFVDGDGETSITPLAAFLDAVSNLANEGAWHEKKAAEWKEKTEVKE